MGKVSSVYNRLLGVLRLMGSFRPFRERYGWLDATISAHEDTNTFCMGVKLQCGHWVSGIEIPVQTFRSAAKNLDAVQAWLDANPVVCREDHDAANPSSGPLIP